MPRETGTVADEVSEGNGRGNWARDHSYDIWQRIWPLSTLVLRTCLRLNKKIDELISLAERISKHSIEPVAWLLLTTLIQVYSYKE